VLARSLVQVANALGTRTTALLTNMDVPLGLAIGNSLEVEESLAILRGEGPLDTTELTLRLGAEMLLLSGLETNPKRALRRLRGHLEDGSALETFAKMVRAHGGDAGFITGKKRLRMAKKRVEIRASGSGYVTDIDPMALAQAALRLGAGRLRVDDRIEPQVGLTLSVQLGAKVTKGDVLAVIHTENGKPSVESLVSGSFEIGSKKGPENALVLAPIRAR
jgi:pyrimidine-nucleoside phosphorylase